MAKKLRIGIVGAGRNTRDRHIPGLQALPDVEVAAVCNRTEASSRSVASTFGIARTIGSWRSLVEDPAIDAVVIGTWPYLHCPVTLAALEAGKHVLCEARMAMNAEEARLMLRSLRAHPGLVGQIVPSPMTLDIDATIARMLRERALGEPFAVDVVIRGATFPDRSEPLGWRQDETLSGGNIMSMGIWYEAIMRWIGPARSVQAAGKVVVPLRPDPDEPSRNRGTRIPDHLSLMCEFGGGVHAAMTFSTVAGGIPATSISIFGTEATLRFDGSSLRLFRRNASTTSGTGEAVPGLPEDHRGWQVERDFVSAIRDAAPVRLTDFETGVRYMDFTDAVWKSLGSGSRVALAP